MIGIVSSLDIIVSSIIFAVIYIKTRNFIYTFIMHSGHNLMVEILLNTNIDVIQSEALLIISTIILLCSAIALKININKQCKIIFEE